MIVSVKQNGRGKSTNTFNEKNAIGENEEKTDLQSNNQWSTCRRNCETMMIQTETKNATQKSNRKCNHTTTASRKTKHC